MFLLQSKFFSLYQVKLFIDVGKSKLFSVWNQLILNIISSYKHIYRQMSSSKDQQNFTKAIQIYSKKYQMNIYSLLKFIEQKVSLSQGDKKIIQDQIISYKSQEAPINKEELKMLLHLVSAVQNKVDVRGKRIQSFGQFFRISFYSSKGEKGKTIAAQKDQKKSEVKVQTKSKEVKEKIEQKKYPSSEKAKQKQIQIPFQYPTITIPPKQQRKSKQELAKSPTKKLQIIQQNIIDENRISDVYMKASNTEQLLLKIPQAQMMYLNGKKSVQITGYDKFGQNYLNPIIKYHIVYEEEHSVYRRYSQFQRLMNDLNRRYEGFILPELPPKEGIKSNLSYFWGVDQAFLNQRQLKLEQMLNLLICSKFVNQDQTLIKFLSDQDFQIQQNNQGGAISMIKSISSMALNTNQLKHYGIAYYTYLKQFKKSQINTQVTMKYKQVQSLLNLCLTIDNYRNSINSNFQRRRDIFKELKMDEGDRNLTITKFDKMSSCSASEIKNLSKEVNKYLVLKSQQSWLNYLVREKETSVQSNHEQLKKQKDEIINRISTMQKNLLSSIQELQKQKTQYLQQVGNRMIQWRKAVHP